MEQLAGAQLTGSIGLAQSVKASPIERTKRIGEGVCGVLVLHS